MLYLLYNPYAHYKSTAQGGAVFMLLKTERRIIEKKDSLRKQKKKNWQMVSTFVVKNLVDFLQETVSRSSCELFKRRFIMKSIIMYCSEVSTG